MRKSVFTINNANQGYNSLQNGILGSGKLAGIAALWPLYPNLSDFLS